MGGRGQTRQRTLDNLQAIGTFPQTVVHLNFKSFDFGLEVLRKEINLV